MTATLHDRRCSRITRRWLSAFTLLAVIAGSGMLSAQAKQSLYLSPGFGVTVDFEGELNVIAKVSVGTARELVFRNVTVELRRNTGDASDLFLDVEYQQGRPIRSVENDLPLRTQTGWGAGVSVPMTGDVRVPAMRLSFFTGYGYFVRGSLIIGKSIRGDGGFENVVPLLIDL